VSLEETELKIGGTSFKGVYIAILFSLATTLGGGVWTASSLYSRLESVESRSIPDITPLEERILTDKQALLSEIDLIKQELSDNDVSQLQGKLATLGVNLQTIIDQQDKLLLIDDNVNDLEKDIEAMKGTVAQAEVITKSIGDVNGKLSSLKREVEELWQGLDYLSNPLK
jgi:peptidoglycan hydrolase CwlO-like protein